MSLRGKRYSGGYHRVTVPIAERFWTSVKKTETCWLWTAGVDQEGYGQLVWREMHERRAHRVSWVLHYGPVPAGRKVLHTCDTPACVRPDHLFVGSDLDNIRDCVAKGRRADVRGERNPQAKLTAATVCAIRERYAAGGVFQEQLAAEYAITQTLVSQIVRRVIWKQVA